MAIITFQEIIDLVIMIGAIGFIFKDVLRVPSANYDPLKEFAHPNKIFSEGFRNGVIIAAPAVVLHEAGHKVVAMLLGYTTTFHASYIGLAIGIGLKLIGAPFLIFIPGYVSYSGFIDPISRALVAVAGPAVNLLLFAYASYALKMGWHRKYHLHLVIMKQMNLFLFFFNLIPFGLFDGKAVLDGILSLF